MRKRKEERREGRNKEGKKEGRREKEKEGREGEREGHFLLFEFNFNESVQSFKSMSTTHLHSRQSHCSTLLVFNLLSPFYSVLNPES